jgi:hypothetical protein
MNDLNNAPLMLLVQCSDGESKQDVFAYLSGRYDARVDDPVLGPKYKVGPTFGYRDQRFVQIQTFAGSLVLRIIFDVRQCKFDRPVIFRVSPDERFTLLGLDGSESEIKNEELARTKD